MMMMGFPILVVLLGLMLFSGGLGRLFIGGVLVLGLLFFAVGARQQRPARPVDAIAVPEAAIEE
jgi:hypothetical protein